MGPLVGPDILGRRAGDSAMQRRISGPTQDLRQPNGSRGFTLVEALVVIGVIGVIIGLVFPAMASFRAESKSNVCLSNLRQLYSGLEIVRQHGKDLLPYAAPLPTPSGQVTLVPGLPEKLSGVIKTDDEIWLCPADQTDDAALLRTSYIYVPGAFMLLEPPIAIPQGSSFSDSPERLARVITQRYSNGYLRRIPVLADNNDHHDYGNRFPRNAVFIDGNARVVQRGDGDIAPPEE